MSLFKSMNASDWRPPDLNIENVAEGVDAYGPDAVTEAVRNLGAEQAQNVIHAPHTLYRKIVFQTVYDNSNLAPALEGVQILRLGSALANYLILSPSAGGQAMYVALTGAMDFSVVNGVYAPVADVVIPAGGPTIFLPLPARDNWEIALLAWSNPRSLIADAYRVAWGYQPLAFDRKIGE